ncbi:DNA binding domain-containing protein, excisionase family [Streptomyces sp. Cmuel-A718b]|nr:MULTISPECIES: helix-turn-helix domain-containing protein [unclassified Streptomyces]SCF63533.1 DNA binding domain-containing protein, excisionase family [Streptomyces sp. Cmuel-A718b]
MRPSAIPHVPAQRTLQPEEVTTTDPLLTVEQAAHRLGTGVRFIRRLVQERRIRYVKLGKPVRIPESAIAAYIEERTVPTLRDERSRYGKAA